ncbi:MAG: Jag N-terminal domain-containing protein [Bacilli bacterium]|nr:Jag N-terminal domain-containing protein [Bacilli bacterium]
MEKYTFSGKTIEEATNKALEELNVNFEDIIINEKEKKQGLFSGKKVEIEIIKKSDIVNDINDFLLNTTSLMGLDTQIEIKVRDNTVSMRMFSNNNPILIGKNGQTLSAFQTIIKQMLSVKYNTKMNIILDVEHYKEKQIKNIEYIAKKTAREVVRTKIEAKLDPMNSYQRRAVHNVLTNFRGVYTESVGEEPNRAIVIKPKN